MRRDPTRVVWPLLLVLLTLLLPRLASASRPVIVPGREQEILALLAPHALGDEIAPGWTLHSFEIDVGTIELRVAGPDDTYAELTLDHPEHGPRRARPIRGFALTIVDQPAGSEAAIAELITTLERNDDGSFWQVEPSYAEDPPSFHFKTDWGRMRVHLEHLWEYARDGIVLLALFFVVLIGLVVHKLRGAERWMKWALLGIVAGGAALRVLLAPEVALAPWPYSRLLISAGLVYDGPTLAVLGKLGLVGPIWLSETITTSTLVLAVLAPLAVYVHARYLLDDHRAALIVAAVIACLPLHLRFSHSDAAFIPSITVSSVVFTLVHVATREPSRRIGWFAVAVVGFPLALVYLVRPLNIMYCPLLVATAFVDQGLFRAKPPIDRVRTVVTFLIIGLVTVFGGIPWLLASFREQVSAGLSIETLITGIGVLFNPRMNALINPVFTPPGLTALALVGAVDLWRRGMRPLFWFLLAWLLGFLIAHAYVIPNSSYMQARYHLHLIVPYMLLAAAGIDAALRWLLAHRDQRAWLAGRRYLAVVSALLAYVAASPIIHLHFIRNVAFNETREWLFVHSLRDSIPDQCNVIEYVGDRSELRFARVGAFTYAGVAGSRWQVSTLAKLDRGDPLPAELLAVFEDPSDCLYWYEGLACIDDSQGQGARVPACDAITGHLRLEPVAHTEFESAIYDAELEDLDSDARIGLTLYRASPR